MKLHKIFNPIKGIRKKLIAALLITSLTVPAVAGLVAAENQVKLEGNTKSLNVTAGETEYKQSTNAKVDEVVQVQLWQHNRELPGTTSAINNKVKFTVPTQPGKTQIITGTSSADNANTITDSTTVNLSLDRARVEYMPGTAKFRYNKGAADGDQSCITGMNYPPERCYATVTISDSVVTEGVNLDTIRGGPMHGCNAYHETVTIQVRAKADVVSVNKYVRHAGESSDDWKTSTTAKPGDDLEYMIKYKNEGNTKLEDIVVGDNLPKYNSYVNGSTKLQNGAYPNGTDISNDNITKGGINTGNYMPGAVGYVLLKVELDPIEAYEKCGTYDVRNVGVVRPKGMNEFYNTAKVLIKVECGEGEEENPIFACEDLTLKSLTGRKVRLNASASASGGAKIKRYIYNFGDGSTPLSTDKTTVEYEYKKDGTFNSSVQVVVDVDGQEKIVTGNECVASVTFKPGTPPSTPPETPKGLPNTGPGNVIAAFVGVTFVSSMAYYIVVRRFAGL